VYFGTDFDAVYNAELSDPEYVGNVDSNQYDPGGLEWGTNYFWRIDGVKDLNDVPPDTWRGDIWSFTTAPAAETLDFYQEEVINISATGKASIEGMVTIPDSVLADLYRQYQTAYEADPNVAQSLINDTQKRYALSLGAAVADLTSEMEATIDGTFKIHQSAKLAGLGRFNEIDGIWKINIGPQDVAAVEKFIGYTLIARIFESIYLESLPGEQEINSSRRTEFRLPDDANIVNGEELGGLTWAVDFGGGSRMRAYIEVEGRAVILIEEISLTERSPTLLIERDERVGKALEQYTRFTIKYSVPGSIIPGVEQSKQPRLESLTAASRLKSCGFSWDEVDCYWVLYPPRISFDRKFTAPSASVGASVDAGIILGAGLYWDVDFDWGDFKIYIDTFRAWITADRNLTLGMKANVGGPCYKEWSEKEWGVDYDIWFYWGIPILVRVSLESYASAKLAADGSVDLNWEQSRHWKSLVGAHYDDRYGWFPLNEHTREPDESYLCYVGDGANARLSVGSWYDDFEEPGIDLGAYLYNVFGPFVRINPYLDGQLVGTEEQGTWTVKAGFTAWGGIQLAGWLKELLEETGVGVKLWEEEWEIDSGSW